MEPIFNLANLGKDVDDQIRKNQPAMDWCKKRLEDIDKARSMESIISNLKNYLLKEVDAPMSSESHFYQALYEVIKTMPDEDIVLLIRRMGVGYDAIKECVGLLQYLSPENKTKDDLRIKRLWEENNR